MNASVTRFFTQNLICRNTVPQNFSKKDEPSLFVACLHIESNKEIMQGKIVLITGGNDGIGKQTAIGLAQRGAHVVIACRNMDKAAKAIEVIKAESENEQVEALHLDLASLASVKKCAEAFQQKYEKLDVLINNAGLFTSDLRKTEDGFELQFGVNHLGHFLLTNLLLPQLQAADVPRVVNVSSTGHYGGDIDFENLRGERGTKAYNGFVAYSQSKLMNVMFAKELTRRYPKIVSNALHPGVVSTAIGQKNSNIFVKLFWFTGRLFMLSQARGAKTSIFLASAPEAGEVTGRYFDENQREKKPNKLALDENLTSKVWDVSERFVAEFA